MLLVESVYPIVELNLDITKDLVDEMKEMMNDTIVLGFNRKGFEITGNLTTKSAILKMKHFYPAHLLLSHVLISKKFEKDELNLVRTGTITATLSSVEIQEFVGIGEMLNEIYERMFCKEVSRNPSFRGFIKK